ncbi:MAG: PEP-CTERM sorting domain-containing protein [Armatimonadetes bacterium]|nr:PEP-CTERM sorting domain-containing protein [Armatimonadota bacterium]
MKMRFTAIAGLVACVSAAQAYVIVQPTAATSTHTSYTGGEIERTIDQSGLFTGYTSGVTDFDAYIASSPYHTNIFFGYEWWVDDGSTTDTLIYDLGAVYMVDRVALWNEESAGLDSVTVTTATLSDFSDAMGGGGFTATDWPETIYLPDVHTLAGGVRATRYVKLEVTADPTPSNASLGGVPYLSMGEFAVSAVPEPATMAVLGLGAAALLRRRRR